MCSTFVFCKMAQFEELERRVRWHHFIARQSMREFR